MMIRPVINFADKYTTKALNAVFNTGFLKNGNDPFKGWTPAGIVLVSLISKDFINCVYYVSQSLNNERIPEEKRKFVAAMDLANGLMNVLVQVVVAGRFKKFAENMYDKHIEKRLFSLKEKARLQNIATHNGRTFIEQAVFDMANKVDNKKAKDGLVAVVLLLGLQTFIKRIVTPLIATPMATYLKPFLKSDKERAETAQVEQNKDAQKDKTADNSAVVAATPKVEEAVFQKFI